MRRSKFKKPVAMSQEHFDQLKEALAFLSPKQRLIIYLRFWDNMTIQEIARYIGHTWSSTDTMIDGAVNHLRVRTAIPAENSFPNCLRMFGLKGKETQRHQLG